MIEKYQLQRLIDLPIEGVAERLGLSVHRHKARCPFHNDAHPSLTFHVGKNRYRCYVCGAHGRSIDLVMNRLGLSFVEACRWLAQAYGIQLSDGGPATYGGFNSAGSLATGKPTAGKGTPFPGKPAACCGVAFSGKPAACNGADFQGKPAACCGVAFPERSTASEAGSATEEASFDVARYQRFFERPDLTPAAQAFLFEERHIDPRVARFCRLHSFRDRQQTNWLQIPYFDLDGRLVGIQNRNLDYRKSADSGSDPLNGGSSLNGKNPANSEGPSDGGRFVNKNGSSDGGRFVNKNGSSDGGRFVSKNGSSDGSCFVNKNDPADGSQPRFRFPKGSKCGIYNLPVMRMLKPGEPLFITEGCSDCWAMLSSGHKAIAIPSATLLKEEDLQLLRNGPDGGQRQPLNLHMFPDADVPGERLFLSLRDHLPQIVRHQLPAGCKDFGDYWKLQQRSVR